MKAMRSVTLSTLCVAMAACTSSPSRPVLLMEGRGSEDVVRLTNGEIVRGRIVEESARSVVVEREDRIMTLPRAAVYSIDYSRESWNSRTASLKASESSAEGTRPSTSWYARSHPSEQVEQTEVLWFDGHGFDACVGMSLAKAHADAPDVVLFADPGGKVLLHDPRMWGYHAHAFPAGFYRPNGVPGLSIDFPAKESELAAGLAFVSPAQEMKSQDGQRGSFTPPDAVYALLRPIGAADGLLAVQPFSGGRPQETRNGTLWAFTLPRNDRQFYLCLWDPAKRHGETLKAAFAGYGDTILAPDLLLDSVAADGTLLGRVLVLPYPDGVAADGPAPEPLTVYAGPTQDPARVGVASLPPRLSLQLPGTACATRVTLLVSHFEISPQVPQSSVTAWGTERPSMADVHLAVTPLTAKNADQLVRIDVSGLEEGRFPAVAWFYHRRTYAWKTTGGFLTPENGRPLQAPAQSKLTKVKKSEGIPHALPILFKGPKAESSTPAAGGAVAPISGGMATSVMADSLAREAGGSVSNALTSNLASPSGLPVSSGGQGVSSVTNVYITAPSHTPMESGLSAKTNMSGVYLSDSPGAPGKVSPNPWGMGPLGPVGTDRAGVLRDHRGGLIYDPATGQTQPPTSSMGGLGVDPVRNTPTVSLSRRNYP